MIGDETRRAALAAWRRATDISGQTPLVRLDEVIRAGNAIARELQQLELHLGQVRERARAIFDGIEGPTK